MAISFEQMQALLDRQKKQFELSQMKLIKALTQKLTLQHPGNAAADFQSASTDLIINSISEFIFDPLSSIIFDTWFKKYEDIFELSYHTWAMQHESECFFENWSQVNMRDMPILFALKTPDART